MLISNIELLRLEYVEMKNKNLSLWLVFVLSAVLFGLVVYFSGVIIVKPGFDIRGYLILGFCLVWAGIAMVRSYQQHAVYQEFRRNYKSVIITFALTDTFESVQYSPQSHISNTEFDSAGIFPRDYNKFSGEDLIKCRDNGNIQLSEICVQKETTRTVTTGKTTTTVTETETHFKGIFGYADFAFAFDGSTFVLPRTDWYISNKGEKVTLESPRFMEIWNVFTTNQIGARLALGTDIMNNLLYLKDHLSNTNIYLSFVDQKVYFAYEKKNFLEPDWKVPVESQSSVASFLLEIQTIQKIINLLKLNQNK
jgi:hypothetical protein